MKTRVVQTPLAGVVVVEIDRSWDERGFFVESWSKRDFAAAGLEAEFVQDNHSRSSRNILRGLHYQDMTAPIGKLLRCTLGSVFDVAADLRVSSSTFGKWFGIELSADNKKQLYVPVGFAHGFAVLSEYAELQYKQTGYYAPTSEGTLAWNDLDIGIAWPVSNPVLSKRDENGMSLREYSKRPAFQ